MVKSLCHLLMKVNHVIVANFYIANMSFNAIHENKFLAKFPNLQYMNINCLKSPVLGWWNLPYCLHLQISAKKGSHHGNLNYTGLFLTKKIRNVLALQRKYMYLFCEVVLATN